MTRYKHIDTSPRYIAVDLERQLILGTFGHALDYLIDHEPDPPEFDGRYRNDATGLQESDLAARVCTEATDRRDRLLKSMQTRPRIPCIDKACSLGDADGCKVAKQLRGEK